LLALLLAAALYGDAAVAFTFQDPRISESSGLASSSTPGIVFTHNDSGDDARFFAVDESGRTVTTYTLPDVQARDWEDMARGPDEQGRSSLWLGDIGDNNAARDRGLLVHRVPEPVPGERERVTTEPPTSFRLVYEDGPGDAEGLLVHPGTGRLYVISKPLAGPAKVYAAPEELDPDGRNTLELVAEVPFRATGTPGGPGIGGLAQLLVTAGDISPDGTRVALRTYTDLYEWAVEDGDVAAAFEGEPAVTPLPETRQGEGLAYAPDGSAVLVSSEGEGAPVHRLTAQQEASAPSVEPAPPPPAAEREAERRWPLVAAGGILLALLLLRRGAVRRRRYTRR
jgi:hypothetical protein